METTPLSHSHTRYKHTHHHLATASPQTHSHTLRLGLRSPGSHVACGLSCSGVTSALCVCVCVDDSRGLQPCGMCPWRPTRPPCSENSLSTAHSQVRPSEGQCWGRKKACVPCPCGNLLGLTPPSWPWLLGSEQARLRSPGRRQTRTRSQPSYSSSLPPPLRGVGCIGRPIWTATARPIMSAQLNSRPPEKRGRGRSRDGTGREPRRPVDM